MQKIQIALITLTLTFGIRASTFFLPDSDTASLIMLVSNTASTVTNTLKILEVAKKTSEQVDKYNSIAMRRYFIGRRIEQHVNDLIEVKKMKPRGLREINQAMRNLKSNLRGLKGNIDFLAKDIFEAEDFIGRHLDKVVNSSEDEQEAHNQELQSANSGSMAAHMQNAAMNTALSSKILTKIRRDSLDYQKADLSLKRSEGVERLRKDEFYRDWIGAFSNDSLGESGQGEKE